MISTINEAVVTLSNWVELSILGKATVMLVIGLTVVKLAGRARASVRHLLLAATFATVFALPMIMLAAPEIHVGVPAAARVETIAVERPVLPPFEFTSTSPEDSVAVTPGTHTFRWDPRFRGSQ